MGWSMKDGCGQGSLSEGKGENKAGAKKRTRGVNNKDAFTMKQGRMDRTAQAQMKREEDLRFDL